LIEMGAIPYEISNENIYDLVNKKEIRFDQIDIFNTKAIAIVNEDTKTEVFTEDNNKEVCLNKDLYNVVSGYIPEQLGNGMNLTDASKTFNISKGQMNIWLKRLCEDRLIKKSDNIYYKND
ncbi:MAG TPA: hypothetical protein GX731_04015, partial [Clostridiales bacterium]|nr:hypothetical protein [Clostridiales bacterium]